MLPPGPGELNVVAQRTLPEGSRSAVYIYIYVCAVQCVLSDLCERYDRLFALGNR